MTERQILRLETAGDERPWLFEMGPAFRFVDLAGEGDSVALSLGEEGVILFAPGEELP